MFEKKKQFWPLKSSINFLFCSYFKMSLFILTNFGSSHLFQIRKNNETFYYEIKLKSI